ncbi:Tetratricopeptide repeat protein 36 [Bulinus truncatus]|nr:Tetratricopeptide repeat protein 36 [Bulinus truncatus]
MQSAQKGEKSAGLSCQDIVVVTTQHSHRNYLYEVNGRRQIYVSSLDLIKVTLFKMAASLQNKISQHDEEILNQIFNPSLPFTDGDDNENRLENGEDNTEVTKAKELEISGVRAAESGDINAAINLFTEAMKVAPLWPSAYNNRAQALRLKGDIEGAKADLDKALELSNNKGSVACQAYTQRGLIRKREGDDEGAKQDFTKASELGSRFCKQILASMNPYAALCNQMLSDVMKKIRQGVVNEEI